MRALYFIQWFQLPSTKGDWAKLLSKEPWAGNAAAPLDSPVNYPPTWAIRHLHVFVFILLAPTRFNSISLTSRFHSTPPWVNHTCVRASSKTPPKHSGKKCRRKEYITCASCVASIALLKTLREKTQCEELTKKKKYNSLISESSLQDLLVTFRSSWPTGLQDQFVIFWTTNCGLWFKRGFLPMIPTTP